jgi:hypothetical protein
MKRKLPLIIGLGFVCMSYTTVKLLSDPNCPLSYTGAPKAVTPSLGQIRYCNNSGCHQDFGLNNTGGSVVATGLPSVNYASGAVYNFSLKITHATADRKKWGFAIKAVNAVDNKVVGTFSTTNANASVKGTIVGNTAELSHSNAASSASSNTYSYINLKWTAPAIPTANETNIKFYITGNAGDGDGSEVGDYVYTTIVSATLSTLPVSLTSFTINPSNQRDVNISWQTAQEINTDHFEIETSTNSSNWLKVASLRATGNSSTLQSYSFTDKKPTAFNSNIYYRLKTVDLNGSYTYSEIKSLRLKNQGIIIEEVTGQPLQAFSNSIFTIHSNQTKPINIAVMDINGRLLYKTSTMLSNGINTITLPGERAAVSRGIVIVKFTTDGFEKTFKQLIK